MSRSAFHEFHHTIPVSKAPSLAYDVQTSMITEQDIASLVPDCYAEFRQIVAEGVMFYLQRLSPARLMRIVSAQAKLPLDADVAARTVLLLHESPALHKLGQVIARRRELDQGLRQRLQQLESMEPRTPIEQTLPIILRELGDALDRYRIRIEEFALAEASVAVVVPFSWSESSEDPRQQGVFKVLKPHVEEYLNEDLAILGQLSDYIDARRVAYGLPAVEYRETFDEASAILTHEVRLAGEQTNLAAASRHYARWRDVQVPGCLPFSTPHVTAMQRVYGRKVTEMGGADRSSRQRLARTIVRALVADPVLSLEPEAMFHADPHAGNLMATSDARLGILDWSLTGTLTRRDRVAVSQVLVGGLSRDPRRTGHAIEDLAVSGATEDRIQPLVNQSLVEIRQGTLPGLHWFLRLLDGVARAGVRFRPDLLLFRKAFFTLEGVVADLSPGHSIEEMFAQVAIEELAGEWPHRWLQPPCSRQYPSHLSNADLLQVAAAIPTLLMNWWLTFWLPTPYAHR